MPFTPLHMGPGIVFKAILQSYFSLMVFGWAQIVMDLQPLVVLITKQGHLHGFSHSYIGATLLALFSALSGKYLAEFGLVIIKVSKPEDPIKITWWVSFTSAFIGTYSHIILDSIMHSDMAPFYPLSQSNGLLGLVTIDQLTLFCLLSAVLGACLYYWVQFRSKQSHN